MVHTNGREGKVRFFCYKSLHTSFFVRILSHVDPVALECGERGRHRTGERLFVLADMGSQRESS